MLKRKIYFRANQFVTKYKLKQLLKEKFKSFKSTAELADVVKSIQFYFPRMDVLIDIGAYKGYFTNAFNNLIPTTTTFCIEPNEEFIEDIKSNNKEFDVSVFQFGLSNIGGESTYFLHEDPTMNSIVESNLDVLKQKFPYDNPTKLKEKKIQVTTLDILMKDKIIEGKKVFIKIDTQGNEFDVLHGAKETLKLVDGCLIEHMFVEAYKSKYSVLELIKFMDEVGFQLIGVPAILKRPSFEISSIDFLFMKKF